MEQGPTPEDVQERLAPLTAAIDLAWRTHADLFPDQDDLVVLVRQQQVPSGVTSMIGIIPRDQFLGVPHAPLVVQRWFAGPAGEAQPQVPNVRAVWVFVIDGESIVGMARFLREAGINAPGGFA